MPFHAESAAGLVMGGVPITLLDTAGLRESSDKVERIGVERSLAAAKQADIVLMVMDAQASVVLCMRRPASCCACKGKCCTAVVHAGAVFWLLW